MKVLTYTTSYLAAALLITIAIWAAIFYYAMLDEIYDSIDDGLDNQKGLVLQKAARDSSILSKNDFDEGDYAILPFTESAAREFRDTYTDTSMFMQNEQDYEPVRLLRTAFELNGKYYQMLVATSMVEEDDLVRELLYALIWLYLGLIAIILALNNLVLRRIWRPFYHLISQLKKFRVEMPSIQVKPTTIEEFRLMNEAVQKMAATNADTYNSQKTFIENAAHELQTPLAISINKLETLAETAQLSEGQSKLLSSALDNLARLTSLNRSLLLLTRIENRQFASREEIKLNDLVKKMLEDFGDQLAFSNIGVNLEEKETCIIIMNADLAQIMLTNLLKNAIVHNDKGGTIQIVIQKRSFSIANTGRSIALDTQKLFTRFNKELPSPNSTGLGLSIVKAITTVFKFRIEYAYDGLHRFRIEF